MTNGEIAFVAVMSFLTFPAIGLFVYLGARK